MKYCGMVLALGTVAFALPHAAQAAGTVRAIPGYFNPETGTFAPLVTKSPAAAPINRTGTVRINVTITIQSTIGTGDGITCSAGIGAFDSSYENSASAGGVLTRSGSKGTLTLTIPYNWTVANASETASVSLSCETGSSEGGVLHSLTFTVPGFTLPTKAGTVTNKNLAGSM